MTDWRNLLALAPDGCFGIDCDGELRATTTAVCFGRELAWIGMVLTQQEYQRRGLARRLMEHALQHLRNHSVAWIKLDATELGVPLYEKPRISRGRQDRALDPAEGHCTGRSLLRQAGLRRTSALDRAGLSVRTAPVC